MNALRGGSRDGWRGLVGALSGLGRWALALALVPLSCALGGGREVEPKHLHVVVERLPQCPYGVGYEQPLRVDLLHRDQVLATTFHSGMYTGDASLEVPLHVPQAVPGRYTIRFGRCPSMLSDPLASVACEAPEWIRETRVRLRPAGIENPQRVEYYRVRAACLPVDTPAPPETESNP